MFEYAGFVNRNPLYALKNWRAQYSVRKAILNHRKVYNKCEWCGTTTDLQVHHVTPVLVDPLLAADPANLWTLCRKHHHEIGHDHSFRNKYDENIKELCLMRKVIRIR